jgi:hypothetical protein
MIELAISMSMLMIGLVSAASATMRMHHLREQNRERTVAQNTLRSIAERIHAQSYRLAQENPDTWAQELLAIFGPAGTYGGQFDNDFLTPIVPGAGVGRIDILLDETATDEELGVEVGMPRDLNGDLDSTDTDVTWDARLLPVVLSMEWRGQRGVQRLDHAFYLTSY